MLKARLPRGNAEEAHTVAMLVYPPATPPAVPRTAHTAALLPAEHSADVTLLAAAPRLTLYNTPLYVYGEYTKLSREMTQTPLRIAGRLKTPHSVADFTLGLRRFYDSAAITFIGCGREDLDVRCLAGRPFLLEIPAPRRNLHATAAAIPLHPAVALHNCCVVTRACKDDICAGEPTKLYVLDIYTPAPVAIAADYQLEQRTPLRVLHRRADTVRQRRVAVLACTEYTPTSEPGRYYRLVVRADSGTYIKEWVHGDLGRTRPALGGDLLALDVLRVEKSLSAQFVRWPLAITPLPCAGTDGAKPSTNSVDGH